MAAFLYCACGSDGGGGRGAPGGLKEITPEEYEKLVQLGDVPSRSHGEEEPQNEFRLTGNLSGKGDADSFEVNAQRDQVGVVFTWPEGDVDFWVKIYGQDGDELGDFDLDNGEIIQLLNGGKFTVVIYSKEGGGSWSATYRN